MCGPRGQWERWLCRLLSTYHQRIRLGRSILREAHTYCFALPLAGIPMVLDDWCRSLLPNAQPTPAEPDIQRLQTDHSPAPQTLRVIARAGWCAVPCDPFQPVTAQ